VDGKLCTIFCEQQRSVNSAQIIRFSGDVEIDPTEVIPAHFQLVTVRGDDVMTVEFDPAKGTARLVPIRFHADSKSIARWEPASKVEHLPPHRVMHTKALEAFHGKQLGEEFHLAPGRTRHDGKDLGPCEATPQHLLDHLKAAVVPVAVEQPKVSAP
jgi:hypothetical protein